MEITKKGFRKVIYLCKAPIAEMSLEKENLYRTSSHPRNGLASRCNELEEDLDWVWRKNFRESPDRESFLDFVEMSEKSLKCNECRYL